MRHEADFSWNRMVRTEEVWMQYPSPRPNPVSDKSGCLEWREKDTAILTAPFPFARELSLSLPKKHGLCGILDKTDSRIAIHSA